MVDQESFTLDSFGFYGLDRDKNIEICATFVKNTFGIKEENLPERITLCVCKTPKNNWTEIEFKYVEGEDFECGHLEYSFFPRYCYHAVNSLALEDYLMEYLDFDWKTRTKKGFNEPISLWIKLNR